MNMHKLVMVMVQFAISHKVSNTWCSQKVMRLTGAWRSSRAITEHEKDEGND